MNTTTKNIILLVFLFLISMNISEASDNRIKIAIIDTGIRNAHMHTDYFCNGKVYPIKNQEMMDKDGHGTNIAGIIMEKLDTNTHCLVIYKVWSPESTGASILLSTVKALAHAIKNNVSYINISMGGSTSSETERQLIEKALKKGIIVNVAAGNESQNLDADCNFFPACYREISEYKNNFNVIGSWTGDYSNYGKVVTHRFDGSVKDKIFHLEKSGTSQATAVLTRNLIGQ